MKEVRAKNGREGSEGKPGRRCSQSHCVGSRNSRTSLYGTPTAARSHRACAVSTFCLIEFLKQQIRKLASENQSNLPKVTGLEWNPRLSDLKTCGLSAGPHCSPGVRTFSRWTRSGPSYASAELSTGTSCPRSGRQLLPPSRTRGSEARQGFICFFLPWLWGSLTRHACPCSPRPQPLGKGCCILVPPRVPGERRGFCDAVWVLQNLSPSSHLAQADIKIHLHSPCTRLADGGGGGWVRAGGCSQRPSWASRATEQSAHPSCPIGPAQAGATLNAGVPPHPHSLQGLFGPDLCFS